MGGKGEEEGIVERKKINDICAKGKTKGVNMMKISGPH